MRSIIFIGLLGAAGAHAASPRVTETIITTAAGCETQMSNGRIHSMSAAELADYFKNAEETVSFIRREMRRFGFQMDRLETVLEPDFNRIAANGALSVVFSDGIPEILETPLGAWTIVVSQGARGTGAIEAARKLFASMEARFGLEMALPAIHLSQGVYGPIYRFRKDFIGNALPWVIRLPEGNVGKLENKSPHTRAPEEYAADLALWKIVKPRMRQAKRMGQK